MWLIRFKQTVFHIAFAWLLAVIIQGIGRLYLLIHYGTEDIYTGFANDITNMFMVGSRFDIRAASILYAPLILAAMLLAANQRLFAFWRRSYLIYTTLMTVVVSWLTLVNVYYYKTYERAIDLFIFGLIDDDTKAVLITLWQDYPVATGVSLFAVAMYVLYRVLRWWLNKWQQRPDNKSSSLLASVLFGLVIIGLTFIGARGGIGTFPLRQSDTQVSEVKLLNMLTPSPILALDWAYKDYKRNSHFAEATDDEGRAILSTFFAQPTEPDLSVLMATTGHNELLKQQPPHVVFVIMESMGSHLLSFDNPERDLFGSLRQSWQEDLVFERFVSEGDGTIDSLSRFFVRSPFGGISQSTAQDIDFKSNMFKPYLENGYKVIFVTSGNGGWRNLNQFLPHLGATEFVEQNKLKSLYPEAQVSTWGVPDEYIFRYVEARLEQADKEGEHLLFVIMSTTHHPPYRVPEGYSLPEFTLTESEQKRLANLGDANQLINILGTLRYSNDQLGNFLNWLKHRPLKDKTIVAITGDHNIRGIGYPNPEELVLGHGVPFYLYVPPYYGSIADDITDRAGSHKDIWPTLYNLSLSDTPYYQTGCDLLATQPNASWCFGYNPEVIFDEHGAYVADSFRPWDKQDPTRLRLAAAEPLTVEQQQELNRRQEITPLLKWQLNRQVHGDK